MRICRLVIERKTDTELAADLRGKAQAVRRGGLGRTGSREADRAGRRASRLEGDDRPNGK